MTKKTTNEYLGLLNLGNAFYAMNLFFLSLEKKKTFRRGILFFFCVLAGASSYFISDRLVGARTDFMGGYHVGALSIKEWRGYTSETGKLFTHRPPGLSLSIAPIVDRDPVVSLGRIKILNMVLYILSLLVFYLAIQANRTSISATLLLAVSFFWPPLIAIPYAGGSELLFFFFMVVSLYLFSRIVHDIKARQDSGEFFPTGLKKSVVYLLFGMALGFSALTRTIGLSVIALTTVMMVFYRRNLFHRGRFFLETMFFFMGVALVLFPWMYLFYTHTGNIGFTTAGLDTIKDGFFRLQKFEFLSVGKEVASVGPLWKNDMDAYRSLFSLFVKDPLGMMALFAVKSVRAWYSSYSGKFDHYVLFLQIPWLILYLVSWVRLLRANWGRNELFITYCHVVFLAVCATATITYSIFRYLSPVFPIVLLGIMLSLFGKAPNDASTVPEACI